MSEKLFDVKYVFKLVVKRCGPPVAYSVEVDLY